jgi:hypothetical protein
LRKWPRANSLAICVTENPHLCRDAVVHTPLTAEGSSTLVGVDQLRVSW